jgi:predicted transcriptional regulator
MMVRFAELKMILELRRRQGLSITEIARRTGRDPKSIRRYIERDRRRFTARVRSQGPGKLGRYRDFLCA